MMMSDPIQKCMLIKNIKLLSCKIWMQQFPLCLIVATLLITLITNNNEIIPQVKNLRWFSQSRHLCYSYHTLPHCLLQYICIRYQIFLILGTASRNQSMPPQKSTNCILWTSTQVTFMLNHCNCNTLSSNNTFVSKCWKSDLDIYYANAVKTLNTVH